VVCAISGSPWPHVASTTVIACDYDAKFVVARANVNAHVTIDEVFERSSFELSRPVSLPNCVV
jgi:hypothetical protein